MRRAAACVLILAASEGVVRAQPPPAATGAQPTETGSEEPVREGLTIELDGGVGLTRAIDASGNPRDLWFHGVSAAGLDVGIGGFVQSNLALLIRFSAHTSYQSLATTNTIFGHTTFAAAAQWWINDAVFAGAGVGLAVAGGQDQNGTNGDSAVGIGASARLGLAAWRSQESAWRVSVEASYGFLSDSSTPRSLALLFGWQSF